MSEPQPHDNHADAHDESDPNSTSTAYVGTVGIVILVLSIVGLQAAFRAYQNGETESKVVTRSSRDLEDGRAAQGAQLEGYRWVDAEKAVVGIPIDRAMDIVAEEHATR